MLSHKRFWQIATLLILYSPLVFLGFIIDQERIVACSVYQEVLVSLGCDILISIYCVMFQILFIRFGVLRKEPIMAMFVAIAIIKGMCLFLALIMVGWVFRDVILVYLCMLDLVIVVGGTIGSYFLLKCNVSFRTWMYKGTLSFVKE